MWEDSLPAGAIVDSAHFELIRVYPSAPDFTWLILLGVLFGCLLCVDRGKQGEKENYWLDKLRRHQMTKLDELKNNVVFGGKAWCEKGVIGW